MVAQIDEQHAAMVADAVAPAGKPHGLADVALAQRAAGMGAIAMHRSPGNSGWLRRRPAFAKRLAGGGRKAHGGWALSRQRLDNAARQARSAHLSLRQPESQCRKPSVRKTAQAAADRHVHRPRPRSRRLLAHGLDTVYALPGVHNDHLFDAFQRAGDALARRPHPPRAGRGLYGAGRGARDRQAAGLLRGARAPACSIPAPRCSPPTA